MERENGGLFAHDPAIFYDEGSDTYYVYSTDAGPKRREKVGGQIRRSKDLIHFEYIGTALADGVIPEEVAAHTNAKGIWAPDIVLYKGKYRLYYSASTFGSQYSVLGLAEADSPEGPFVHKGIVLKTTPESPVNAIDANIVIDEKTDGHYMVYGSFWGGIRLLKLDKSTGLAAEEGYGLSIAKRSHTAIGAIEGPYIRFNKETGYYYLFVSYDSLSDFYNVRVGRSRTLTGPYLDFHGNEMTDISSPPNHVGLKITSGYSFKPETGFIALGHNSVLNRNNGKNNEWFLVCHARYEKDNRMHCLNVRKMLFTKDGWPIVSPALYSGECLTQINQDEAAGKYLRIDFVQDARNLTERPSYMELFADNTAKIGDAKGKWSLDSAESRLVITYIGTKEEYYIMPSEDREESGNTYVLTGMNQSGNCIWCKKIL